MLLFEIREATLWLFLISLKKTKMRLLKTNLLKISNSVLSSLLFILGFSTSCIFFGAEYGTPNADFVIKGTVTSEDTNQPVPQIKVKIEYDSVYTNQNGKYEIIHNAFPESQDILIQFIDTDGEANGGLFQQLDSIVEFTNPKFKGSKHWYEGKTEKEVDISLGKEQ